MEHHTHSSLVTDLLQHLVPFLNCSMMSNSEESDDDLAILSAVSAAVADICSAWLFDSVESDSKLSSPQGKWQKYEAHTSAMVHVADGLKSIAHSSHVCALSSLITAKQKLLGDLKKEERALQEMHFAKK